MAKITGTEIGEALLGTGRADRIFGLGGNDDLHSEGGNDLLDGGADADSVDGGTGNDRIIGESQESSSIEDDDFIDGGLGIDTVVYKDNVAVVNLSTGTGSAFGEDVLVNIENVVASGQLIGDDGDNRLTGLGIQGNQFVGNAGNDVIIGSNIDRGWPNFDTVVYPDPAGVTVNLGEHFALDGFGDRDTIKGVEGVFGSEFDDLIIGDRRNNWLFGNGGNDTVKGGAGADILARAINTAGGSNEVLNGGKGSDWVWSEGSSAIIDLSAGTVFQVGLPLETDSLISIENIFSGAGSTLIGNSGRNTLAMGVGGAGEEETDPTFMTGGAGADRFINFSLEFAEFPGIEAGTITDFESGVDNIQLPANALGNDPSDLLELGRLSPDLFAIGAAGDENDYFVSDPETDTLLLDPDGSGAQPARAIFVFEDDIELSASDLQIIKPFSEFFGDLIPGGNRPAKTDLDLAAAPDGADTLLAQQEGPSLAPSIVSDLFLS